MSLLHEFFVGLLNNENQLIFCLFFLFLHTTHTHTGGCQELEEEEHKGV